MSHFPRSHRLYSSICVSHGNYINESWHISEWVVAQIEMSGFPRSPYFHWSICVSHSTYIDESWHKYEWVVAQNEWVTSHVCIASTAGWHRGIGCLIFIGQFTHKSPTISGSFAKNDPQLKASYGSSPPCRASTQWIQWGCVLRLIHMCAMTHSYVCHDSFICVPWLIHMCAKCAMTHCMCAMAH